MDPVSALGLATAILSFIEFGTRVFRGTKKLYDSRSDASEENASSELVASHMQRFAAELSTSDRSDSALTGNDARLCELASECRKIADELVQLLEGLKRTDPKSWTQALRVAWKSETHRGKKDDLNKRLESCRSQFQLQLNFYTSKETITRLSALLERSKANNTQVQKLQECVVRLQETLKGSVLNETAKTQVQELLRLPEETLAAIAQERFLRGIRFGEIDHRFNEVRPAHSETFNWLFYDRKPTSEELLFAEDHVSDRYDEYREEQGARDRNRQLFTEWVSSGNGVFHFSAKLGAGKSTLMKEAYNHDVVRAKMREWAGTCELLCGQFFFWRSGAPYQKTLDGMFRGLLYDLLRSKPQLIPLLLPSHWEDTISSPWQANRTIDVTNEVIETSFKRLLSEVANSGSFRLFFFIDGLDEMEENTTHTYQDLVDTINSWVVESSGNVKVCVSSREYSVFLNGFSEDQRLHLHHLTKLDMQRYVRDKLRVIPDARDVDSLSNNIVDKAQGIFFWVTLVTKNIRQQLGDGASMEELLDSIDELPDGLYELFRHVLMSLETPIRKIAYETFAMMEEGSSWDMPIPAIGYAFFKDWRKRQQQDSAMIHLVAEDDTATLMLERSRIQVRRYCKGLVEISGSEYYSKLVFAHRSVRDFLLDPVTAKEMESSNTHFDTCGALSHIAILADYVYCKEVHQLRLQLAGDYGMEPRREDWSLADLLYIREQRKLDTEPYVALCGIDTAHWAMVRESLTTYGRDKAKEWMYVRRGDPVLCVETKFGRKGNSVFVYALTQETYPQICVNSPMMLLTQMGSPGYPVWQARNCTEFKQDDLRKSLLICCALSFHLSHSFMPVKGHDNLWNPRTGPEIVKALLDEGLVWPSFPMQCMFHPLHNKCPDQDLQPSLLQVVFMAAALVVGGQDTDWIGCIIEALLQHTVILDFTISLDVPLNHNPILYVKQTDSQTGRRAEWVFWMQNENFNYRFITGIQDWGPERIVEASGFQNKDRILSLIRGQTSQPSRLVPVRHVVGTLGWLLILVVGLVMGTMTPKLLAL